MDSTASSTGASRRRMAMLLAVAVLLVIGIVAFALVRGRATAEDCDKKPPPNQFAVAGCDEGTAPGGAAPAASKP